MEKEKILTVVFMTRCRSCDWILVSYTCGLLDIKILPEQRIKTFVATSITMIYQ